MRNEKWSENKIKRWISEGRGQGTGPSYKPWLTVQDVPNGGRRHRPFSQKFGRDLELFSDIEYGVFLIAEHSPHVLDAAEQRPINRDLSRQAAATLGIRHPCYPRTKVPVVMTVDLLVTVNRGGRQIRIGIDSKTRADLEKPGVPEKLQLTKRSLAEEGHEHLVICDAHLPKVLIQNLIWIRSAVPHEAEILPYPAYFDDAADRLLQHLRFQLSTTKRLRNACNELDRQIGWESDTSLRAARLLLHTHRLHVDLRRPDIPGLPLNQFSVPEWAVPGVSGSVA